MEFLAGLPGNLKLQFRLGTTYSVAGNHRTILSHWRRSNRCATEGGRALTKPSFDLAVLVPLELELEAFFEEFPSIKNLSTDAFFAHEVDSDVEGLSMVVVHQIEMGHSAAGDAIKDLLAQYDVRMVVCIGIAGGLSGDLRLGDVCYSGQVIDVYENSKAEDALGEDSGVNLKISPKYYSTPDAITRSLNYIRTQPDVSHLHKEWAQRGGESARELCPDPVIGRDGEEYLEQPMCLNGSIACGFVSKSKAYNDKLEQLDRRLLAIETESGAVFRAAQAAKIPAIVIRGISDYADASKGKLESSSKGGVRKLAARNAVLFFKYQLKSKYFYLQISRLRDENSSQKLSDAPEVPKGDSIDVIAQVAEEIEAHLRELSPQYRLNSSGYRLPAPRVRRYDGLQVGPAADFRPPQELREALDYDQRMLVSVPRSYPDQSLPWVIAKDLLSYEYKEKQIVPIVIDGKSVSPPKKGFDRLSGVEISDIQSSEEFHIVFIVDGIPLDSSSRLSFFISEVDKYSESSFIFLSSSGANSLVESDFKIEVSLGVYALGDISFLEVANFIQSTFELDAQMAEVVAKRLWDTFSMFGLSAHPTYFAGIPRETLTALLHANRRSELIQLAVQGFLSFVVVGDKAPVSLSRTTREEFLKQLILDMKVELQSYDRSALVKRVEAFAKENDFDIDALSFLKAFEDQGILHFDDNFVEFSLPFIEHYLLASALTECDKKAEKYFDLNSFNFDPQVFDIYAELRPSKGIKEATIKSVDEAIVVLSSLRGETHILLRDDLRPRAVSSMDKVRQLKNRLDKAVSDVHEGGSNSKKKQRLLDLADIVRDNTAKHARDLEEAGHSERMLDAAMKSFVVGVILLGSGVERLNAAEKRHLGQNLIRLGADIIDVWTAARLKVDFSQFKEALLGDERIAQAIGENGDSFDRKEVERIVSSLIDIIEGAVLSDPFRSVLGIMCEQARSRVLEKSLENVKPEHPIEKLLHALWLTDIAPESGKALLKSANGDLPPVIFLRFNVVRHCLSRAFWSHWRKPDRLALLDAADDFVRPIAQTFDKAALKRQIENSKAPDRGQS